MSIYGALVSGCYYCCHADKDKMKCYPESKDCKSEYDLEESDFDPNKKCNCDFFLRRKDV